MKRISAFVTGDDWEADWEAQERWQMVAGLAATPTQRLVWLEEMRALALRSGALQGRLGESSDDDSVGDM
jgi:hypothetical protein